MPDLWQPISDSFATTRNHLHQIAYFAISPARYAAEGRMGLKPTNDGFGTPRFGSSVARVEEDILVFERDGNVATQQISDVRSAAEFFAGGYEPIWFDDFHDPLTPIDPDFHLEIVPEDTRRLGAWFAFGFDLLNELRGSGTARDEVSEAQIWPEHFDAATEMGREDVGGRASFGVSPGDGGTPEPYLYVAPWADIDADDPYWNATHFNGSILPFSALREDDDQHERGIRFYLKGYRKLH